MKKTGLFIGTTLVAIVALLLSCKAPQEFMDTVTVAPNPLELHAGKVSFQIEGTFPEKYFDKELVLKVTPVLVSNTTGKRYEGAQKIFQGEKIEGNGTVVSYKKGGRYSQNAEFVYQPDMESCVLFLEAIAIYKGEEYVVEAEKIADGVVITPLLVTFAPGELCAQIMPDKFQRLIEERQEAEIKYLINQSNIRTSETKSAAMVELTKAIKSAKDDNAKQVKSIEISSYASPDGAEDINENLAKNRDKASQQYVKNEMKKLKSDVTINSEFTAEDWNGFKTLMENSSIQDKDVILSVLSRYTDPEEREAQIKMLSGAYKEIATEILPQLRRSRITLVTEIVGKSDDEIKTIYKKDPSKLSVEELLYAATLTDVNAEKEEIYNEVIKNYPNDVRGYNNLGVIYFNEGKYADADRMFKKVYTMDKQNGVANYNCAVMSVYYGDVDRAEEFLGKANGVGENIYTASGVVNIQKGRYNAAVSSFGKTVSNNAALANIMNKDYMTAREILDNVKNPTAETYYLLAIVGARTDDHVLCFDNLKKAIVINHNFANKAAKDLEFREYFTNTEFQNILK
ncbi:MAG: tetratricopeptide repeat protein [Paludibacteraceae bacterium]|nr:tetratricopeptide repeat protein [Paludibacteraceae bacterium]